MSVENFDGLDQQVVEGLETYFSHGYDGGSFVSALLQQDYREALLSAHASLSRRSIIEHMDYAKGLIDKHGYDRTFEERIFLCYHSVADKKMKDGMKAVCLSKHTKPFEVAAINKVWDEEDKYWSQVTE